MLRALIDLEMNGDAGLQLAPETALDAQLAVLRGWQSGRLARTYADYLADEHYRPACQFFLSDIYAPQDFSQRDQEFEQLYALLKRYLPGSMLRLLGDALVLNRMSNELDRRLLRALEDELGMGKELTPELYAGGYRLCDNQAERLEQIERLAEIIREIGEGAHYPMVGMTLRVARYPAHRLGWYALYDFLERGYRAFQPMRDIGRFVGAIQRREKDILKRIFEGHPDPFRG